jgi:hypothetical protein
VTRVYLADHKGLYPNPRLHPLSPTPKTHCFKPRKLQSDAVPKSTLSGAQRSGLTGGQRLEITHPTATGFHADGVVIKLLSDTSLCFKTCVILRADNTSRLVDEYVRMFLRRYASPRLPPKQMELWLPPELSA